MERGELKAVLYDNLQKRGILENLKTQLRYSLIRELKSLNQDSDEGINRKSPTLVTQAINSLIAEYLRCHGCEYSLSTFGPEANIDVEKLLSYNEIIEVLKISGLNYDRPEKEQGLLHYILTHMSGEGDSCRVQSVEKRLLALQHECEARSKKQLEMEMSRFRDKEISMMRIEEKNKYQKKIEEFREQTEAKCQQRISSIVKECEEERQHLKQKEQELDSTLYLQRQTLLEEMEVLKMRCHNMANNRQFEAKDSQKVVEMLEEHRVKCESPKATAAQVENNLKQQLEYSNAKHDELLKERDVLRNENNELVERISGLERAIKQLKEINLMEKMHKIKKPKGCETSKNVPLQSDQEMKELKHEVMALQFANKQLQKELIIKNETNTQLQQTVGEQTLQLCSTSRELNDLHDQVNYLHTVLTQDKRHFEKTQHNSKPQVTNGNPLLSNDDNHSNTLHSLSSSVCSHGNSLSLQDTSFSDTSAILLAEARATFARMDAETKKLASSLMVPWYTGATPTVHHTSATPTIHDTGCIALQHNTVVSHQILPTNNVISPPVSTVSSLVSPPASKVSSLVSTVSPPVSTISPLVSSPVSLPVATWATVSLPVSMVSLPVSTMSLPVSTMSLPVSTVSLPVSTVSSAEGISTHIDPPPIARSIDIPPTISNTKVSPSISSHDSHVTQHSTTEQLLQEEWIKKREEKLAAQRKEEELEKERVRRALEELQKEESAITNMVAKESNTLSEGEQIDPLMKQYMERVLQKREATSENGSSSDVSKDEVHIEGQYSSPNNTADNSGDPFSEW